MTSRPRLGQVRRALSTNGGLLDAEELLDALWLAARLPPAAATALARAATLAKPPALGPAGRAADIPAPAASPTPGQDTQDDTIVDTGPWPAQEAGLFAAPATRQSVARADRAAVAVRASEAKALGGAELRLGRSLRPLKQLRPDALRTELDIDATVMAMAETGLPEAVLRRATTRWLDLAILVDDGVSMLLWQRLAGELRGLLMRSGAFRNVRVHGLDTRGAAGPRLRSHPYGSGDATVPMSTVLDPAGNTLLLVVSDGVGRAWRDSSIHEELRRAASVGPTAVVHTLPRRLWAGTGIDARPWRVTAQRRGSANRSWRIEDPFLPPELAPFDGVPIPVLSTDGDVFGTWARLISSLGGTAVLPLLTLPLPPAASPAPFDRNDRRASAEEAVMGFRASASSDAYRLAAHLASVAPLPVPVMRLVQHAVAPAVDTSHLAEVFLGGLMHSTDDTEQLPHQRTFDFSEEIRQVLLGTVPPAELMRTTQAVTARLGELHGSSAGFPSWLPHPEGTDLVSSHSSQPFGWVDETLMRRLGVSPPSRASQHTPPEKTSGKHKSGGRRDKRPGQGHKASNSFAGASFEHSQVLGNGTQTTNMSVQTYAPVPTALNALPGLPQEFTGREDETTKILSLLDPGNGAGAAVGSVAGLPGAGKTTLAHAVGHAALGKGWFTGVQLVNLRGYDPDPVLPQDALEALLRSLGVAVEHIPATLEERAALYRSQLDALAREGQRLLILADNASTSDQVRSLLPARHHAVLVTSRHTLPGLGARLFNLHPLQPDAAVNLLHQRLEIADPDDRRVQDEPAAAEELAALCGYLPLALQIAAALLTDDPDQPLSERVRMLTDAGSRLDGLDDGERNLRAVFDECLTRLTPQQADLYRLLGLHPGPDISTPGVAALTDQPADKVTPLLRQLVQARLLIQNSQSCDRWYMHDLLRVHAQEEARITMDRSRVPRRRYAQARTRLIDYYVRFAEAANTHLGPPNKAVSPLFAGREQALAWFDRECENLLAVQAEASDHTQTARLSFALGRYLEWRRRLQDLLTVHAHTLDVCQALGDTRNQAAAWNNLGAALGELHRFQEAYEAHQTALDLHQQTGDTHNQAIAWNNLGTTLRALRRHAEALEAHQTALNLHQQTGDTHNQAIAWNNFGAALGELHRFQEAYEAHQTALELHQQTGDGLGEADAWVAIGITCRGLKRYRDAIAAGETAVATLAREEDWARTAAAWGALAATLSASGSDPSRTSHAWMQSAVAYTRAGDGDAATAAQAKAESTQQSGA